jgi:hypothetical protein
VHVGTELVVPATVTPCPVPHVGHAAHAIVEAVEYSCAPHDVQVIAPVDAKVSVILPAAQAWQAVLESESLSYSPAGQAVHVVPPVADRVSVILPAAQATHDTCPGLFP